MNLFAKYLFSLLFNLCKLLAYTFLRTLIYDEIPFYDYFLLFPAETQWGIC